MGISRESQRIGRVIIFGAGAVGSVVGRCLALAGREVVLIGRAGHVTAIRAHGLTLTTLKATHVLRVPAVTDPGEIDFRPNDAILLCVKGFDTDKALSGLHHFIEDIPIFCA